MGYTTDFEGQFTLNKRLDLEFHTFLMNFSLARHMKRNVEGHGVEGEFYIPDVKDGYETKDSYSNVVDHNHPPSTQPGLWCQWRPNDRGTAIIWDGGEKFYNYVEWIKYIITNFLAPKGYELDGEVHWQGEDHQDFGVIAIQKNKVFIMEGQKSYSNPKKLKIPFKTGDLVTGKDRSYKRSIYKMMSTTENPDLGLFEFQSLRDDVVERWKDLKAPDSKYLMSRSYNEFRLADKAEILEGLKARSKYYLLKILKLLDVTQSRFEIW